MTMFQQGFPLSRLTPESPSPTQRLARSAITITAVELIKCQFINCPRTPLEMCGSSGKRFQISKRILGPEHPETLAAMGNFASTLRELGRHKEAEPLAQENFQICKRTPGP